MTDLEQFLVERGDVRVDPSHLKVLGKKAAAKYVEDGTSLNSSISELAKEASLNEEQTKRVVEHANTATFLALFNEDYDSNIEFPVADYEKVASQALPESPTQTGVPHVSARSYIPGQEYVSLEDVFMSEASQEKTASEEWTSHDKRAYFEAFYKVKHATADLASLENSFELRFSKVKTLIHQLNKEGDSGQDLVMTVKEAGVGPELAEMLLDKSGVTLSTSSDTKSNRVVNKEHTLYKEAAALNSTLEKITETKIELTEFIKSAEIKRSEDLKQLI